MLHQLRPAQGAKKSPKRVGRGPGSGHGKTSCRGQNGQRSRSGRGKGPGFEGGQMPLQRRVPKRGFYHKKNVEYVILNLKTLAVFDKNARVTPEILLEKGFIRKATDRVKILADGAIEVPIQLQIHSISKEARRKVEEAGGKVEVLD